MPRSKGEVVTQQFAHHLVEVGHVALLPVGTGLGDILGLATHLAEGDEVAHPESHPIGCGVAANSSTLMDAVKLSQGHSHDLRCLFPVDKGIKPMPEKLYRCLLSKTSINEKIFSCLLFACGARIRGIQGLDTGVVLFLSFVKM